jgi:hypothetical protein
METGLKQWDLWVLKLEDPQSGMAADQQKSDLVGLGRKEMADWQMLDFGEDSGSTDLDLKSLESKVGGGLLAFYVAIASAEGS